MRIFFKNRKIKIKDFTAWSLFGAWTVIVFLFGALSSDHLRVVQRAKIFSSLDTYKSNSSEAPITLIQSETERRFSLYNSIIEKEHLFLGMVVHRELKTRKPVDECDSLLFSALRVYALETFGFKDKARQAWLSLLPVIRGPSIKRHPRCQKAASRDMILGLLIGLASKGAKAKPMTKELLQTISKNDGFFSRKKTHFSFLTPNIAFLLHKLALVNGISGDNIPKRIKYGFATTDLDIISVEPGYRTHLIALSLFLEIEIVSKLNEVTDSTKKRWQLISERLVEGDSKNLFFEYLRKRSHNKLTRKNTSTLLHKLNSMAAFPKGHLPLNCNRKADYTWMRHSWETSVKSRNCDLQFSGVDYLFLSSILLKHLK